MLAQETFKRLPKGFLKVGNPISFPLYDKNGQLFSKELLIESEAELEELFDRGLYLDLETSKRIGLIKENKKDIVKDDALIEKTEQFIKLPFKALKLGETLQLTQTGEGESAPKYLVKLIGVADKKSLICAIPTVQDKTIFVKEGAGFLVQFFSGKSVYRFSTVVDAVFSRPYPHMHLMYPREAFVKKLRKNQRVEVDIVTAIKDLANPQAGILAGKLVDLSMGGALLEMQKHVLAENATVECGFKITLDERELLFAIKGTIKSVVNEKSESGENVLRCGIQFEKLPFQEKIYLQNYIYQITNEEKAEEF
jgi:c-di-GMP-binding flagellar brake protein YcgR